MCVCVWGGGGVGVGGMGGVGGGVGNSWNNLCKTAFLLGGVL